MYRYTCAEHTLEMYSIPLGLIVGDGKGRLHLICLYMYLIIEWGCVQHMESINGLWSKMVLENSDAPSDLASEDIHDTPGHTKLFGNPLEYRCRGQQELCYDVMYM